MHLAIFDNEYILDYFLPYVSSTQDSKEWEDTRFYSSTAELRTAFLNELDNFLNESSSEYQTLFVNIYNKLTPKYFKRTLDKLLKTEKIITSDGYIPLELFDKEAYIQKYEDNYKLITEIYKKHFEKQK